jgi:hypothetical protein
MVGWCRLGMSGLAAAMQACLTPPRGNRARMGEAARRRVLVRHDIDIEARKLIGLFQVALLKQIYDH